MLLTGLRPSACRQVPARDKPLFACDKARFIVKQGTNPYTTAHVVLASQVRRSASVFLTCSFFCEKACRTNRKTSTDLNVLFPRPFAHIARAEPDVLKEQNDHRHREVFQF